MFREPHRTGIPSGSKSGRIELSQVQISQVKTSHDS